MTREERENTLHCLKVMVEEANCEDCKLYGTTGTDHCERDCVRNAIQELEQETILEKIRAEIEQLSTKTRTNWDGCCPDIDYPEIEYVDVTKAKLLDIIDKYTAESEE